MRLLHIIASLFVTAVVVISSLAFSTVFAQQAKPSQTSPQKAQPGKAGAQGSQLKSATPVLPNDEALVRLICSTLIALNQANATGNYSVFRELSAPGFQVANSTGQLAETFAKLRSRNFDLSAIVLLQPKLLSKPEINARSMLRVIGFFPTQPERLNFDLMYQFVEGQWRLFGIATDTAPIEPATALSVPQPEPSSNSTDPEAPAASSTTAPPEPETQQGKPAAKTE